jgi:hypothetical protein
MEHHWNINYFQQWSHKFKKRANETSFGRIGYDPASLGDRQANGIATSKPTTAQTQHTHKTISHVTSFLTPLDI